ncbi:MAG: hypothetical protein GEU75_12610 [Dehalococcoidia bacterium]|nr:hypothetical protein [Dehalococcoidia bacterium]
MRFAVESWAPDYGSPLELAEAGENDARGQADVSVEVAAANWQPIRPEATPARTVVFVDGVQQMDARLWMNDDEGPSRMGVCVSLAAGTVLCNTSATVELVKVRRVAIGPATLGEIDCGNGVIYYGVPAVDTSPAALDTIVRRQREDLEVAVAHNATAADLLVVDGHVRQRETIAGAVGYLKTHQAQYLEPEQAAIVGRLKPGERTPVFLLETPWSRYSWYLKLPGGEGHPWAGVIRCEASTSLKPAEVSQFADFVAATLPRFASEPHKEPRAPQNLYPIGGLERDMRRRLGDQGLLLRNLQRISRAS